MAGCRALTQEETEQVLNLLKTHRDKTMFILGMKSGFRISELLTIRVKDVIQNRQVVNRIRVKRGNMKNGETRDVALHPMAKEYILKLIQEDKLEPEHYLFRSRKGDNKPITRVQAWTILKAAFNAAGMAGPTGTHSLRKSFAKDIFERSGHNLVVTQKALGHSDMGTTVSYVPVDEDEIDKLVRTS